MEPRASQWISNNFFPEGYSARASRPLGGQADEFERYQRAREARGLSTVASSRRSRARLEAYL